jgi:signal transduction histidine kinase
MSSSASRALPLPLEAVVSTVELDLRPARPGEFQAESQALVDLMKTLKDSNGNVLQALAETALRLCRAHSAGVSILEEEEGRAVFRWHGAAGQCASFLMGTVPREASPCGTVLDRNAPLLMSYPQRHFGYPVSDVPPLVEVLLVPFQVEGISMGTVWVIAHDDSRQFDREDLRLLRNLSEFASLTYQVTRHSEQARQSGQVRDALAKELAGSKLLQAISAGLVGENESNALYEQILDAALAIMQSHFASMQMLGGAGNELRLIASRGFHPRSALYWGLVRIDSDTSCGRALRTGKRFIIPDTESYEPIVGTEDLEEYRRSGIRSVQSTPLTSRTGQLVGVLSTHWNEPHEPTANELRLFDVLARLAADLLERAKTEQDLREVDRRKDEFLAVLSHELRNPLAPLTTGLELLQRPDFDLQQVGRVHSMMRRQLLHLVRLVDDLLDLSRITRNKINLQCKPLDVRVVIEAAVELSKPLIEQREHILRVDHAEGPLVVHGDRERLTQVIANLLSNAAKYMAPNGTIHLRYGSEERHAVIRTQDTGYGIPQEHLETIFEMFNQVPEHRARGESSGLGIGLALSRRLVELHQGSITAHSEGTDRGSEFQLRLPLLGT